MCRFVRLGQRSCRKDLLSVDICRRPGRCSGASRGLVQRAKPETIRNTLRSMLPVAGFCEAGKHEGLTHFISNNHFLSYVREYIANSANVPMIVSTLRKLFMYRFPRFMSFGFDSDGHNVFRQTPTSSKSKGQPQAKPDTPAAAKFFDGKSQ